jgi:hypothetical protein
LSRPSAKYHRRAAKKPKATETVPRQSLLTRVTDIVILLLIFYHTAACLARYRRSFRTPYDEAQPQTLLSREGNPS